MDSQRSPEAYSSDVHALNPCVLDIPCICPADDTRWTSKISVETPSKKRVKSMTSTGAHILQSNMMKWV